MLFVNYQKQRSGKQIDKTNNQLRLEFTIKQNLTNANSYYARRAIVFNNSHFLGKLCRYLETYIDKTPKDTYQQVKEKLDHITRHFSIVYQSDRQHTHNVLLGDDVVVSQSFYSEFDTLGNYIKGDAIRLYNHDLSYLDIEQYLETTDSFSLIGLDLPLLAAQLHHFGSQAYKNGDILSHSDFITNRLILPVLPSLLDIGLFNRLVQDSKEETKEAYDEFPVSSYYQTTPVNALYKRASRDYQQYFNQLKNDTLSDLFINVPLFFNDLDNYVVINHYNYNENTLWVEAYTQVDIYKKLNNLITGRDLRINKTSQANRLMTLLGHDRYRKYVDHLAIDLETKIKSVLKIE